MIYLDQGKRIMNKMQELIFDEFKVAVHFDRDYTYHGTTFFNIYLNSVGDIKSLAGGLMREYIFDIRYYLFREGYSRANHHNYLSNTTERLMRLFHNSPSPDNEETTFSTYLTRWAYSIDYYNLITHFIYFGGVINDVNYNPTLSDSESDKPNLHVVNYQFTCTSSEPDYE